MPTLLQGGGRQTQKGVDGQEDIHPKHENQKHEEGLKQGKILWFSFNEIADVNNKPLLWQVD